MLIQEKLQILKCRVDICCTKDQISSRSACTKSNFYRKCGLRVGRQHQQFSRARTFTPSNKEKQRYLRKMSERRKCFSNEIIEIIDIECVLLSFLSKKIVSTKWRIFKGILVGPMQTPEARYFVRLQLGVRIVFSTAKFANNILSRLKMEKKFCKGEKVSKNPFQWAFLRKAIVLYRIYTEIVV